MRMLVYSALGTVLVALGIAPPAGAAFFTLQDSVTLNQNGLSGTIDPVLDYTGTIGLSDVGGNLVPDEGGATFAGVDVFVVDITLGNGSASIDALGITIGTPLFFTNPVGAGAFDDLGIAPTSVLADNVINFGGQFDFSGGPITQNTTTVRLFVTYSPLDDIVTGQTVNFMVSSGTDFTVQGLVIPEPTTGLLLLGGLLGIARLRPHRRHS